MAEMGSPVTSQEFGEAGMRRSAANADAEDDSPLREWHREQQTQQPAAEDPPLAAGGGGRAIATGASNRYEEDDEDAVRRSDVCPSPIIGGQVPSDIWHCIGDEQEEPGGAGGHCMRFDAEEPELQWCPSEPATCSPLRQSLESGPLAAAHATLLANRAAAAAAPRFNMAAAAAALHLRHSLNAKDVKGVRGGAAAPVQAHAESQGSSKNESQSPGDEEAGVRSSITSPGAAQQQQIMASPLMLGRQSWASLRGSVEVKHA